MRVLVTRPETTADRTLRRLALAGHDTLLLPLSEAEHLPIRAGPLSASAVVATSAEAFRALRHSPEALPSLVSLPVYCVGDATAEAALDLGFSQVRVGPGDAAGLAELILHDRGAATGILLYLAGTPRLPQLETRMTVAGVPLQVRLVYRMRPVVRPPGAFSAQVRAFSPDAVLFYSREAARQFFFEVAPAMLADAVRILCLGPRIADAVPPGCRHVEIAPRPDEDALLTLLDA
ncbi:uroporphyrinogen-III synthase [Rhizobium sp. PP-F2F-G48]|uniref:uroporphyrinogen-III synthase n=1 Tax=Rhizobium sp. PP-F2F-G48 TaxID=2135651 RepID=UPI0010CE1368|nr:uroporphyrinogen-III synthase [Rhizobium sp. PP-F2F-G48]TCM55115.1 uroporphyrinogen-III synthase [Rhizobium sp. PP-F2F-G48]